MIAATKTLLLIAVHLGATLTKKITKLGKYVFLTLDVKNHIGGSCYNYYKWFLNNKSDRTIVSYEYPMPFQRGKNERYYPIVGKKNDILYNEYLSKAKELHNVHFLGRLGDYRYYDMDKAVARGLELFEEVTK